MLETIELKEKKTPGLNTLANLIQFKNEKRNWKIRNLLRNIEIKPLGEKTKEQWIEIFEKNNTKELQKLDEEATKCVEKFWDQYGLKINYKLEHKLDNTSLKAFTILKAHYALHPIDNTEMIFKFRGLNENEINLYKKMGRL